MFEIRRHGKPVELREGEENRFDTRELAQAWIDALHKRQQNVPRLRAFKQGLEAGWSVEEIDESPAVVEGPRSRRGK